MLLRIAWSYRWLVLATVASAVVISWAAARIAGVDYVADATFTPQGPDQPSSGVASVAAQFGVQLGQRTASESLDFYAHLLKSRQLLRDVVQHEYEVERGPTTVRGTLINLYELEPAERDRRIRQAVGRLRRDLTVRTNLKAGLVTVEAAAPFPELSEQIVQVLLERMNEFNLEQRQSKAGAEKDFTEARLQEVRRELSAAEDELAAFLETNRSYQESPGLRHEADRLQRQVSLKQEVYRSLAVASERSAIEAVRNTPVITVIEPPDGSARAVGLWGARLLVLSFLIGLALAGLLIAALEYYHSLKVDAPSSRFSPSRPAAAAEPQR